MPGFGVAGGWVFYKEFGQGERETEKPEIARGAYDFVKQAHMKNLIDNRGLMGESGCGVSSR